MTAPGVPLNQTQSQVMRYVHAHPACKASEIADHTGVKRANVSTAITELKELGYLTARRDDHDGRVTRIEATPQAIKTLTRLRASWSDLISTAWGEDVADLDPVIARMTALLDGLNARKNG